ncbi:glycine receptor subunit alpha-3 isoform X3 [Bemisia tabaci]|uniref:glycine receptor subunit alpha-3 isoform X3 n=1 Tax=Bemisia tabaci TaxID=7038 RepID=UPI003B2897AC
MELLEFSNSWLLNLCRRNGFRISNFLVLICLCHLIEYSESSTSLTFNDILPEDPKLYDKMRPPKKDGNPTIVFFHVTVMGLDSIDESSMTYAADIFFAQSWKDNRLRLPENMTSEYRLLEVDWLKNMWRPDSFFKNAKAVTFQTMTIPNHYVWLYKDKTILYMVKLTLTLSCAMNFMIYPHDTQECKLQMESLSHTTDDMVFQWDPEVPLVVGEDIELPQLQLVKNRTADCTQVYSTGNFTCLEVVFELKRRLGYYLFHTYIPTCLIVIMSVCVHGSHGILSGEYRSWGFRFTPKTSARASKAGQTFRISGKGERAIADGATDAAAKAEPCSRTSSKTADQGHQHRPLLPGLLPAPLHHPQLHLLVHVRRVFVKPVHRAPPST